MQLHPTSALLLLTLLLLLPIICLLFLRQQDPKKQQPPPADDDYKAYPLLGTLPHFLKNQHRLLPWSVGVVKRSPRNTVAFKALGGLAGIVLTANPDNVEHIVKASFANYPKGNLMLSTQEDFLGHGILNSDGDHWLWQRKAASHDFHSSSRRKFIADAVQLEVVERLLPLLELAAHDGRTVDVQDVLHRFAFDNICSMAFGHEPACLAVAAEEGPQQQSAELVRHAIDEVQNRMVDRFRVPENLLWQVKRALNLGPERQLRKALAVVHGYADKVVQDCRDRAEAAAGPETSRDDDFLTHYAGRNELAGRGDESLRDFVTNILVAGSETTPSALVWFFWLLSGRPDVENKIVQEIRTVRGRRRSGSTTALSSDELREMDYLHAAITEAMRLYPPVPLRMYSCKQDDVLPDGTHVGRGWSVLQSVYAMARLEGIWGEDCEEFRPERWLTKDGAFQPQSSAKYPVFHGGPRMCLGKELAYIQMKYIASSVLERFTFRYLGGQDHPGIVLTITLQMKGGLPMQVIKRTELGGALD